MEGVWTYNNCIHYCRIRFTSSRNRSDAAQLSSPSRIITFHNPSSLINRYLKCNSSAAISSTRASAARNTIDAKLTASSSAIAPSTKWSEFAKNVSGEWDGYGAEFCRMGQPIELPEAVVPEAYREWEVKVFDWQTQCPTLALPHTLAAHYKLIKLLPTVGCEADAATRHSIDERHVNAATSAVSVSASASAFAFQSTGCYTAVWPTAITASDTRFRELELEHCLIDPRNRESRVRIILVVRFINKTRDESELELQKIIVFCEQWYGPYSNGDQLGGCAAISGSAFATTEALRPSLVAGVWHAIPAVACFQDSHNNQNAVQEFVGGIDDQLAQKSDSVVVVREERDLILLPNQLWCSLKRRENGETWCEAGWLLGRGYAITSKCIFSTVGVLKEIEIARETAALQGP